MRRFVIPVIFLVMLFCSDNEAGAQWIKTRLDFVGGIAYPEYLHGGIRYQYGAKTQLGLYYGGDMGVQKEFITTWTLSHMYHFGNNNFYSNRPVWYFRQGFTYAKLIDTYYLYRDAYLELSLGYEFPLNNRIGINFDMGMNIKVYETMQDKEQTVEPTIDPRWYPGFLARLQVYVSL